ncbi:MAG: tetratricopeptide repeat protein [Chthoniobacterales bacterium]
MKTIRLSTLLALATCLAALTLRAETEPLRTDLGSYTRKVTTKNPKAQQYFNQGLAYLHGFNHASAIRSFQEAAKADPDCAMAHWGIALAAGPHINYPLVPPPMAELAWNELTLAQQHADKASPVEKALIDALGKRYANPQPEDRAPLDRTYADAMREVWKQYPKDQDVGAFFAESMMDLSPWNQWTHEGQPNPGTEEIVATLDAVMKLNPNHPFANHLYIHAVEASPHPEKALAAANRLRTLQPGLAHNVHMPSHIDIRTGNWQKAIDTNAKAVEDDHKYFKALGDRNPGLIPFYAAHDHHMLAYAALMTGQSKLAMAKIREALSEMPPEFVKAAAVKAEAFFALPMEAMIRFGQWDAVLAEPEKYEDYMPFSRAFHHAARAIAFAAKAQPDEARKEQARFNELAPAIPKENEVGNNSSADIVALIQKMLEAEIQIAEGKQDEGIAGLQEALKMEDALKYDEPPAWMIPIRHSLGANFMRAGRFAEAEEVYREDLRRLPENGWSLYGLSESLRAQKKPEAVAMKARFTKAWSKADIKINSSCLCRPFTTAAR